MAQRVRHTFSGLDEQRGTLIVMLRSLIGFTSLLVPCMAQQPRVPDIELQRVAMKKLNFLNRRQKGQTSGNVRQEISEAVGFGAHNDKGDFAACKV